MKFFQALKQQPRNVHVLHLLLAGIFGVLISQGVILHPDSDGYIQGIFTRAALYPSLLHLFLFLSSTNGLLLLVIFQFVLGYVAIVITVHTLQNLFQFQDYALWVLIPIFLVPYVGGQLGNAILTEAIAYPMFMLGMCAMLNGIWHKRGKDFLVYLVYVTLLVLTRRQFLFLYVCFPVLIVWLHWSKAHVKMGMLGAGVVVSILASTALEKSYHLIVNQRFETAPFGGMSIIIAPLYVSSMQDSILFSDATQRSIFVETRQAMELHKLVPDEAELFHPYAYNLSYDKILYGTLLPVLSKRGLTDPVLNDQLLASMAYTLITQHWQMNMHLYVNNVIFYFGGYYFCALVGMFLVLALYHTVSHPTNFFSAASFFILLTAVGNITATCLFISLQKRYAIYTDAFVVALIMITVNRSFQSWRQNSSSRHT